MANPYFLAPALDDLMRVTVQSILKHGRHVQASKGDNTELIGVLMEISNPLARLSRTETRGKPFSCLGELCWYLAKSDNLEFIKYYIPAYEESADDGILRGAYGPRLFGGNGFNQFSNIQTLLNVRSQSRRAVIQLFHAKDIANNCKDVPCTCTIQFLQRDGALHVITSMRSNDIFLGLPHDIFCFTMLQEIMAKSLNTEVGSYKHFAGSLHLYDKHRDAAEAFLNEGWQQTDLPMPPMPNGDPWPSIEFLVQSEEAIRLHGPAACENLERLDQYWADLVRMLQVFACFKSKNSSKFIEIMNNIHFDCYRSFAARMLRSLDDQ